MSGELIPPNQTDLEIFNHHFRSLLDEETFDRAQTVFTTVGRFNERSVALQLSHALQKNKLDAVLSAYEKIMRPPDGYLHLVPTAEQTAAEVRSFGDVVYASIITDGDPLEILNMRDEVESPVIFDLMGQ